MLAPRTSAYLATSLDGFIARADGGLDWLPGTPPSAEGTGDHGTGVHGTEDYGYAAFIATVDAIVMGRRSFEAVRGFGAWPYRGTPVVVLTSRGVEVPPELAEAVEVMDLPPFDVLDRLGAAGARHLYVDGGETVRRFLAAGCLHELILTRVPVLIGSGIPLFGDEGRDIPLTHVETRTFSNGLVQSRYRIGAA